MKISMKRSHKRPRAAAATLRKNKVGGILSLDLKLNYKAAATVPETAWDPQENTSLCTRNEHHVQCQM